MGKPIRKNIQPAGSGAGFAIVPASRYLAWHAIPSEEKGTPPSSATGESPSCASAPTTLGPYRRRTNGPPKPPPSRNSISARISASGLQCVRISRVSAGDPHGTRSRKSTSTANRPAPRAPSRCDRQWRRPRARRNRRRSSRLTGGSGGALEGQIILVQCRLISS